MKSIRTAIALASVLGFFFAAYFTLRPVLVPPGRARVEHTTRRSLRQATDLPPVLGTSEAARQPKKAPKTHGKQGDVPQVSHQPLQPKSGEPVVVTVEFKKEVPKPEATVLEYQVVEPGKYIALHDPAFQTSWQSLPLTAPDGASSTATGGRTFRATIPESVQKHRRLVRYRVRAAQGGPLIAPDATDSQPNYAYFVYDGLPAWRGAINPKAGDAHARDPVTFPPESLDRVPVYHLISSKAAVEKATWSDSEGWGNGRRNQYVYTGTFVYEGVVYDHVGFRARGGTWRHAMGKNMWKFNFLPGHRFAARDDYGQPYKTKWDKLNLGACIQQGDYGMRGEQGMFEAVGFRLFNLVGQEAPRTHFVHFRIIDGVEEAPASQYAGDFWGLYLAVENIDEHFLKEHDLPSGNLYKLEGGPKTEFKGEPEVSDQRDVFRFMTGLSPGQPDSWWSDNLDLPRYYDYRSVIECIHHYDLDAGKNYFFYHNPESKRWIVLPWDIDLTWGEHMYGWGQEPFYRAGVLSQPPFKQDYQARLAEIRDLIFNPEQMSKLIDEHAAMIWNPNGQPSLVDADRAKWDYHPVMVSQHVMSMKAGQGRFYFGKTKNNFGVMVQYMKSFVDKRTRWIDSNLLGDYNPPAAPKVTGPASLPVNSETLELPLSSKSGSDQKAWRWRLAEVTNPHNPSFNPHEPWKYEIQAIWEQQTDSSQPAAIPTTLLRPGHTYRARARSQDRSGTWSRWSAPAEFTVPMQ